jgi:methylenetetrahydrofolate reductase (NADPH)
LLCNEVPGIYVPDAVVRRLRGVPADQVADEGISLCVETIQQVAEIPGVRGVHLMAFGFERGVPDILERARVGARAGLAHAQEGP